MATLTSPAHVNFGAFSSSTRGGSLFPKQTPRPKKLLTVSCALSPFHWRESSGRRLFTASLILCPWVFSKNNAAASNLLDKYVKRKKLDPLDAYVPAVILTQFQIKDLEKTLEGEAPEFASCRTLLRSGPAASLRVNIRAVAQYASDSGNGKTAFDDVDQCLRALEDLDSLFLRASRKDSGASVKSMKAKIVLALDALDGLLQTVPQEVLDKGKAIADAYRMPEDEELEPDLSDPEIRKLESIL